MAARVRPAAPGDYPAFVRMFPELGVDDTLPSEDKFTREIVPRALFADEGDRVVGYVYFQLLRGAAYVRNLVVGPEARRSGVGRALMLGAAARARAAGATAWALNVKPDNVAALALYRGLGFEPTQRAFALKIDWADVDAECARRDLAAITVDVQPEAEDAATERAADLEEGQIADTRALGGTRALLRARTNGAVVGFAAFDVEFPGAMPFRAKTPDAAFALLRAMKAHRRPDQTLVNLGLQAEPAVVDAILAAGGVLRLEVQNLRGPIPIT